MIGRIWGADSLLAAKAALASTAEDESFVRGATSETVELPGFCLWPCFPFGECEFAHPKSRTRSSGGLTPLVPVAMRANIPRGRTTGSSNPPVAQQSRNSRRLETSQFAPT